MEPRIAEQYELPKMSVPSQEAGYREPVCTSWLPLQLLRLNFQGKLAIALVVIIFIVITEQGERKKLQTPHPMQLEIRL